MRACIQSKGGGLKGRSTACKARAEWWARLQRRGEVLREAHVGRAQQLRDHRQHAVQGHARVAVDQQYEVADAHVAAGPERLIRQSDARHSVRLSPSWHVPSWLGRTPLHQAVSAHDTWQGTSTVMNCRRLVTRSGVAARVCRRTACSASYASMRPSWPGTESFCDL